MSDTGEMTKAQRLELAARASASSVRFFDADEGRLWDEVVLSHLQANCFDVDAALTVAEAVIHARRRKSKSKTHCRNGHDWKSNARVNSRGKRICYACQLEHVRASRRRAAERKATTPLPTPKDT